jgi:hypothetical protein
MICNLKLDLLVSGDGEKPGLMDRDEGSRPRGHGSNPAVYWMDVSDAS